MHDLLPPLVQLSLHPSLPHELLLVPLLPALQHSSSEKKFARHFIREGGQAVVVDVAMRQSQSLEWVGKTANLENVIARMIVTGGSDSVKSSSSSGSSAEQVSTPAPHSFLGIQYRLNG